MSDQTLLPNRAGQQAKKELKLQDQVEQLQRDNERLEGELAEIGAAFGIGEKAHNLSVMLISIRNATRRSKCLSRIEQHFTTIELDEDEECENSLLNWGDSPDDYIARFIDVAESERDRLRDVIASLLHCDSYSARKEIINEALKKQDTGEESGS